VCTEERIQRRRNEEQPRNKQNKRRQTRSCLYARTFVYVRPSPVTDAPRETGPREKELSSSVAPRSISVSIYPLPKKKTFSPLRPALLSCARARSPKKRFPLPTRLRQTLPVTAGSDGRATCHLSISLQRTDCLFDLTACLTTGRNHLPPATPPPSALANDPAASRVPKKQRERRAV